MQIKLFYSYSHYDNAYRVELEKHLRILKDKGIISEWCDKQIVAGEDWSKEIEKHMDNANIILLLFSSDFIASPACKKEVSKAIDLKANKQNTIFIPIILRECSWKDVDGIANIQALPKDGQAVSTWDDKDEAWQNVYEGIKIQVTQMQKTITPMLKQNFNDELLDNPISDCKLDKLFVYPDILESNKSNKKLENNEIDSNKLCDIQQFEHSYILIKGEEQSGKTSLCNMLYLEYIKKDFYPILIKGKNISKKANIVDIVNKAYAEQYEHTQQYEQLDMQKRILIIDEANNRTAHDNNFSSFIRSIKTYFQN